jgi:hypothetical protein
VKRARLATKVRCWPKGHRVGPDAVQDVALVVAELSGQVAGGEGPVKKVDVARPRRSMALPRE